MLFICMGNTARSPAAEYLAKGLKSKYKDELNDVSFDSAGFFNAFSYMQPESREYLDSREIIHSDFRPQPLSTSLLKKQDLIITMAEHHKEHILRNYYDIPNIERKTFTLKEFTGGDGDVIDPYYTNQATYKKVMKEIDKLIEKTILKIIKQNSEN